MEQIHKILVATLFDICGMVICVYMYMDVTVHACYRLHEFTYW